MSECHRRQARVTDGKHPPPQAAKSKRFAEGELPQAAKDKGNSRRRRQKITKLAAGGFTI